MLSKRLKAISQLVPKDSNLADIGSDHGYLLLDLKENGFSGELLGVENKIGPFSSLQKNIKKSKFFNSINTSFSDGLDNVESIYNCIVIAGMGFDNIKKIITKNQNKIENINYFIIDSHTKTYDTRKFFTKLGYKIEKETILKEDGIFYEIILFKKGESNYSEIDLKYGPILLAKKEETFIEKYKEQYEKNCKLIKNLDKNCNKIDELNKTNTEIISILNN